VTRRTDKKASLLLAALCAIAVCGRLDAAPPPIADGHYTFLVKFAEQPNMTGGHLDIELRGEHIRVTSKPNSSVFPAGLVEEGILLWHAATKQWIIGQHEADAETAEVGGCSDGPLVVDLEKKVFWTC
jgi:hypothetical protein